MGAASVASKKTGVIIRILGISPCNDIHLLFFCGIGQGGKIVVAIALTFIALYAAVDG
jgi:hypothetical protein